MEIRGLHTEDFPQVRLRGETIACEYYPELIADLGREHALLSEARDSGDWYARVIGPKGNPYAALIARSGGNLWATRKHATVLLWYSTVPGQGMRLMRDFRDWARQQKGMVLAGFMDDFDMDQRIGKALKRAGFTQRGGAYAYFPRGPLK
jgi:hypothetical protein